MSDPVTLDMSTARPLNTNGGNGNVTLDMSTARGLDGSAPSSDTQDTNKPGFFESMGEGVAAGANETAAGLSRIGMKIPGVKYLSQKAGDALGLGSNVDAGQAAFQSQTDQTKDEALSTMGGKIGYGGETLAEFLGGDAALKGLSWGEKMLAVGKIAKVLEEYPRLIQALKAGANLSKIISEGTPEAKALIKEYPILGRMVAGIAPAVRGAALQTAQTGTRTGDWAQASKEGAEAGGIGLGLGAVLAPVGAGMAKLGKAATTVQDMAEAGKGAIPEQSLFEDMGDTISGNKQQIDQSLEDTVQGAGNTLDAAKDTATNSKETAQQGVQDTLEQRKAAAASGQRQMENDATTQFENMKNMSTEKLGTVRQGVANRLVDSLDKIAAGADDPEDVAKIVNNGINQAHSAAHDAFEEGITGEEGIETRLEGHTVGMADSSLSGKAQEILDEPIPEDKPSVRAAKSIAGDKLDASTKNLLQMLADGAETSVNEQGEKVLVPLEDHDIHDLVQLRQSIRKAADGYMFGDVNGRALRRLLPAIDDMIAEMAENAGDEGAVSDYQNLRGNYRKAREILDSNTVEKLNLNKPDKALNDVGKYLLSGGNPSAKINTLRQAIGDDAMTQVAMSKVKQWAGAAAEAPQKFIKEWDKLADAVKQDFFGPELTEKLEDAAKKFRAGSAAVDDAEDVAGKAIKGRKAAAMETASNVKGAYEDAARKSAAQAKSDIGKKYDAALDAARDVYNSAKEDAQDLHAKASEPFNGLVKKLANGDVNQALKDGKVQVSDIRNLKQAVGEEKWQDIANGLFERGIADAGSGNRFNPAKMVKWWDSINPDVRQEMFNLNNPDINDRISNVLSNVKSAASVQKLMRVGVLATFGTAGVKLTAAVPWLGELLGALAGGTTGGMAAVPSGRRALVDILDYVANTPALWKTVGAIGGKASNIGAIAPAAASVVTNTMNKRDQLKGALSSATGLQ